MPETDQTSYSAGLREGRIIAMEHMQGLHSTRLDSVERRMSTLERVSYIMIGAIMLVQFLPAARELFGIAP